MSEIDRFITRIVMFLGHTITKNDGLTLEMFEKPIFYSDGFVLHGKSINSSQIISKSSFDSRKNSIEILNQFK